MSGKLKAVVRYLVYDNNGNMQYAAGTYGNESFHDIDLVLSDKD